MGIKARVKGLLGFSQHNELRLTGSTEEERPLTTKLSENHHILQAIFNQCADIVFENFTLNLPRPIQGMLVYAESLTDSERISQQILRPLLWEMPKWNENMPAGKSGLLAFLKLSLINARKSQDATGFVTLTNHVLHGNVGILLDGEAKALVIPLQGGETRAVTEPDTEPVVIGPKDGFVEVLKTNLSLIRRRIRSSRLKVEMLETGLLTKTGVAVCYVEGIANPKIVAEAKERLRRINIDSTLSSNYVAELIADEPFSLFPLIQKTERPDRTAAALVEGRVAVLVDNAPTVLLLPCAFVSLLQASEDYSLGAVSVSLIRLLRFLALNIALLLPAFTAALFSFNQEIIPTNLLHTVMRDRQNVPFPVAVELMFMELTFEILREAGVRLPKTIGQAISTVGGLVIGQAAITAGIIGPTPVIVVSLTAISSFTMPDYEAGAALRALRFLLLILASTLGLVGIMFGLMGILIHLVSLRSFGVPYLSPLAPLSPGDLKDTLIRIPWWGMLTRPRLYGDREPVRQDPDQGPRKPGEGR